MALSEPQDLGASWEVGVRNDPGISDIAVARVRRMVRESLSRVPRDTTFVLGGKEHAVSFTSPRIHREVDERPDLYTFECRAGNFRWEVRVVSREIGDGEDLCMECASIVPEKGMYACSHCGISGLCPQCYGLWDGLCLDCAPEVGDGKQ